MTSTFQDTVLDFDLNFLQSSSNVGCESRLERQKKAILIAKKKTIATDLLIRKYYDKKEKLEQSEVTLLASKEECKQVCIDHKNSVEKCIQLEKALQLLQSKYAELEQNYFISQNQVEAMKSHSRQLQVLINEKETASEALKIDSHLEKKTFKDFEKKISSLQKENEKILNHLCLARDIAFGKRKLQKHHKLILQKYKSVTIDNDSDSSMSEDSNDGTAFFDDSPTSPLYTVIEICPEVSEEKKVDNTIDDKTGVKDSVQVIEDHESDYSNGVVSEDTGRGSSLAFSDSEKCVNSPDYFTADSPTAESINAKNRKILIDASTSPRRNEGVEIATSPLIFDEALLSDNPISLSAIKQNEVEYFITDLPISDGIRTLKEKRQLMDCATSPIRDIEKVNKGTSPIPVICETVQCTSETTENLTNISKENIPDNLIDTASSSNERNNIVLNDLSSNCELEISSKEKDKRLCLESNNSHNIEIENSNDLEVEMILNSMRITQRLITPLPPTPVKLIKKSKNVRMHAQAEHENTEITEKHATCQEVLQLREENKALQTSIADLNKEISNIKCILKKQLLMPESPKKSSVINNIKSLEVINDTSQEKIVLNCDGNAENISNENKVHECETTEASENPTSLVMNKKTSDKDQNCSQEAVRCEELNDNETNNSYEHSSSMSPENILPPTKTDIQNNTHDNNNSLIKCREKLNLFGDEEIYLGTGVDNSSVPICRSDPVDSTPLSKSPDGHIGSRKKLSRLDKFKRKLAPQSKIKFKAPPIRKKRTKSKIIPVTKIHTDTVNSKMAYEKALKVMRELKLKKNLSKKDNFISSNAKNVELNKPNSKNCDLDGDVIGPLCKDINEAKNVVCLSKENLEKHMQNIKDSEVKEQTDRNTCFSPERTKRVRSIESITSPIDKTSTTRSRCKRSEPDSPLHNNICNRSPKYSTLETNEIIKRDDTSEPARKRLKRIASDSSDVSVKRVLRSSSVRDTCNDNEQVSEGISPRSAKNLESIQEKGLTEVNRNNLHANNRNDRDNRVNRENRDNRDNRDNRENRNNRENREIRENRDNRENRDKQTISDISNDINDTSEDLQVIDPRQSIICKMIEKYGKATVRFTPKKVSDNITNEICKKISDDIEKIIKLSVDESKLAIKKLVNDIQGLNRKYFLAGFMKYLKNPARKQELYNKQVAAPAPPMTKSEQVLLYILKELGQSTPDFVNIILTHIEFALFHLNKTPEFDVIESLSHFYALTCRYFRLKTRLRVFLLDAMYCLQFKVIPLIKQCLDVWMHILPLAHMGIAKSPLVTCLVYLLHFYKCEDRLNRIQEIRYILNKKYFYKMTDWNEPKILEMFKNTITELREIPLEKKMFRLAIIILAKRHGPKWCQKNIIKNILTPLIENEDVPYNTKKFCISLLGPLLKPYPKDMKLHCEIAVNQLLDILEQNPPDDMKEAIFTSLIYMNKHNQTRVTQALLSWAPKKTSEEFEALMSDFVREKPVRVWKCILSKMSV